MNLGSVCENSEKNGVRRLRSSNSGHSNDRLPPKELVNAEVLR